MEHPVAIKALQSRQDEIEVMEHLAGKGPETAAVKRWLVILNATFTAALMRGPIFDAYERN